MIELGLSSSLNIEPLLVFGQHPEFQPPLDLKLRRYHSLFDRFYKAASADVLPYTGRLTEVLDELEFASINPNSYSSLVKLALHPPRVIRAALNYKVENPDSEEAHTLVSDAIELGLNIYQNPPEARGLIARFRERIPSLVDEDIRVVQPEDGVTWRATDPERSQSTAQRLVDSTKGNDVLFMAFAHGGVAAGMDVYLRFCDFSGSENSRFYIARFSRYKSKDAEPALTPKEVQFLQEQAARRKIILFDEDVASGSTSRNAQRFFTDLFGQPVIFVTNVNTRVELTAAGFENAIGDALKDIEYDDKDT